MWQSHARMPISRPEPSCRAGGEAQKHETAITVTARRLDDRRNQPFSRLYADQDAME
jgi:hypothetical protein